jgi:2-polyprenyl-6-methoxyphenol hydroxylase-like FAD-dependent oxidoreductase
MGAQERIGIVGAGPGGLILARILHLHGVAASVFEREQHSAVRPQGGSLDIHAESGQYAIEQAGLSSEFQHVARYGDQETRVYDKHGELKFLDEGAAGNRPEIDRGQLRGMLLDSLPNGMVRWGHSLTGVEALDNGTFELRFAHDVSERFDLVVGADGGWSRIRPLVSEARPIFSGVMFVELGMADVDAKYPEIARLVGHGLMFALGDGKAIIGHRDANAHVTIYAGLPAPEDSAGLGSIDKATLVAHFESWSGSLQQMLDTSGDRMALRPISALPIGHRWQNRPGVTLLGDAAHLMSPFSGEGANLAMLDAAELALALTSEQDSGAVIPEYEEKMFRRAAEAAVGAQQGLEETFADDGLAHMLALMESHRQTDS